MDSVLVSKISQRFKYCMICAHIIHASNNPKYCHATFLRYDLTWSETALIKTMGVGQLLPRKINLCICFGHPIMPKKVSIRVVWHKRFCHYIPNSVRGGELRAFREYLTLSLETVRVVALHTSSEISRAGRNVLKTYRHYLSSVESYAITIQIMLSAWG